MRSLDALYVHLVVGRRGRWESFRARHPKLFRFLYHGYRFYRGGRYLKYHRLYSRFAAFTMIRRRGYVANLSLCDQFRHVPGAVVECGTWNGGMIAGIASLFDDNRSYYLFDSFEGLPPAQDIDTFGSGESGKAWQAQSEHNCRANEETARAAMQLSGVRNVHVTKGLFSQTLPHYGREPIAILRADGDWYESTMDTLTNLYPYVARGGLILFDDYYYWDGCAKAVHDFLSRNQLRDKIYLWKGLYAYLVKQ